MKISVGPRQSSVVISSLILVTAITACNKGNNRPAGYKDENYLMDQCNSERAFDIEPVNANRIESMVVGSDIVLVRTTIRDAKAPKNSKPQYESEKTGVQFIDSSDEIRVEKDCKSLTANVSVPGLHSRLTGKIVNIRRNSITIENIDQSNKVTTIVVEKTIPENKAATADTYFLAMSRLSKDGYDNLKVTVTTPDKKTFVVTQE